MVIVGGTILLAGADWRRASSFSRASARNSVPSDVAADQGDAVPSAAPLAPARMPL